MGDLKFVVNLSGGVCLIDGVRLCRQLIKNAPQTFVPISLQEEAFMNFIIKKYMQFPSYRVFPSDFKTFFPHLAEEEMERALVVCVLAEGKKLNHVL